MTPESAVLRDCLALLRRRGLWAWRNMVGANKVGSGRWVSYGLRGSADIVGVLPTGRFLAVECKSPSGRLSSEQAAFLRRVSALGGLAVVAHSALELGDRLRAEGYADDGPLFKPP